MRAPCHTLPASAAVMLAVFVSTANAQSPTLDPLQEARDLIETAPNTKANLKKGIALYEAKLADTTLPAKVRADGWADAGRAWMRFGDLESSNPAKLDAYAKGRAAAQRGLAIDPNHVEALFWDTANMATTGRTDGVMNSLFMLGDLRKGLKKVLALDPRHSAARTTLADIDHAVPGIAGGSNDRAEKAYLEVLRYDPNFTPAMVNLAQLCKDTGEKDEAKKWAQKAIATSGSSVPNDWKKFDRNAAQKILRELE